MHDRIALFPVVLHGVNRCPQFDGWKVIEAMNSSGEGETAADLTMFGFWSGATLAPGTA
jgi:hypothetical protein